MATPHFRFKQKSPKPQATVQGWRKDAKSCLKADFIDFSFKGISGFFPVFGADNFLRPVTLAPNGIKAVFVLAVHVAAKVDAAAKTFV